MEDSHSLPRDVRGVPGMLTRHEKRLFYYLARYGYAGQGAILDLGTFLGGSAICFAAGLRAQGIERRVIHSYDVFKVGSGASERYFPEGTPPETSTRPLFEEHLRDYLDLIEIHEGDVLKETWGKEPIEILFVDIAKSHLTWDHLLTTFFPALIPGRSLIILQDYLTPKTGPWHHVAMEKLGEHVEYVLDTEKNSALFLLREAIPQALLEQCLWRNIPSEEKLELMDRAIARLDDDAKKAYLRDSRKILVEGKDLSWGMMYHEV